MEHHTSPSIFEQKLLHILGISIKYRNKESIIARYIFIFCIERCRGQCRQIWSFNFNKKINVDNKCVIKLKQHEPTKISGELRGSKRASSSCSSSVTRRVTLVTNRVINHEWRNNGNVITTNGIHQWTLFCPSVVLRILIIWDYFNFPIVNLPFFMCFNIPAAPVYIISIS
jgi:hypothetical protein